MEDAARHELIEHVPRAAGNQIIAINVHDLRLTLQPLPQKDAFLGRGAKIQHPELFGRLDGPQGSKTQLILTARANPYDLNATAAGTCHRRPLFSRTPT